MFPVSFIHIVFTGLLDALLKGNIVAFYANNWVLVPWYLKDENFIYPLSIGLISALVGVLIVKKTNFGWKYFVFLGVWTLGGLESLSYWLFIQLFNIGQTIWWLPDYSLFWWYPKSAPWLNPFIPLKWLSGGGNVTREAVLSGTVIACVLNLVLSFNLRRGNKAPLSFSRYSFNETNF